MDASNHSVHSRDWYFQKHPSEVVSIVKFTYNVPQSVEIYKQIVSESVSDYILMLIDRAFSNAFERELITLQIVYEDGTCEMVHSE